MSKIFHKEQLQRKEVRIVEQNSTNKSLKTKVCQLKKALTAVESKFNTIQRKSASNFAKLEHERGLFEVKEKNRRGNENKKRQEKAHEKELQKRRLPPINNAQKL